ncbi:uncharacterized protein LOC107885321 [Acyrthosiphon pisum]|uniref:MULE transposase domain-containing protein n=1 Tax=Acyrthosiphon pisum TaxID=7029 RepID=A0A8R2NVQ0_ACYPI|nr:uncharacterized protein LOC107885321 [Acyrthosiphon pisum]
MEQIVQVDVLSEHNYIYLEGQIAIEKHLIEHNYNAPISFKSYYVIFNISLVEDNSDIESDADVIIEDGDDEDENIEPNSNYDAENMQLNRTYTCIPGVHDKSNIYIDNFQYKYYKKSAVRNKMYLICEKQRNKKVNEYCSATAIIENIHDPENRMRLHSGGHNHGGVERDLDMPYLRRAIGRRATTLGAMSMPIRHIYNEEIVSHPAGSLGYTFQQAQHRCKRMKNCRRPKIPETIPELIYLLNMPEHITYRTTLREPSSEFFQQALTVDGITIGVIFANLDVIAMFREELRAVTYAGCDGTFKTTPSSPKPFRRGSLMTFPIVYKNVSFPVVYALLSMATEQTYTSFFRVVRNMLPLDYDGLTIITDYERGLMNAVQEVFPESRLQCCWFHFCQSIVRYCRRKYNLVLDLIKTNPVAARVLRMVLALPHLPANRGN